MPRMELEPATDHPPDELAVRTTLLHRIAIDAARDGTATIDADTI
jgi:hypothetical protein